MKLKFVYTEATELENVLYLIKSFEQYKDDYPNIRLPEGITPRTDPGNIKLIKKQISVGMNAKNIEIAKQKIMKDWSTNQASINKFFDSFPYPAPKVMTVRLSRYGNGGSYYPWQPYYVTILVSSIRNLAETVIHETIHCLIEYPVIIKHHFDHPTKEGLVDWLFLNEKCLRQIFPTYETRPPAVLPSKQLLTELGWNKFK
jgi:hypothetical protein